MKFTPQVQAEFHKIGQEPLIVAKQPLAVPVRREEKSTSPLLRAYTRFKDLANQLADTGNQGTPARGSKAFISHHIKISVN